MKHCAQTIWKRNFPVFRGDGPILRALERPRPHCNAPASPRDHGVLAGATVRSDAQETLRRGWISEDPGRDPGTREGYAVLKPGMDEPRNHGVHSGLLLPLRAP
ncbi:Hypothetical protein CAP_8148 [Chondromyces apiculatus DSM 436]|uniref:Uncharacterized protein n=1 Tax=Chondromyces apiculatus DSM 436 TaxID=1192034 RepID=A0A017TFF7_9BACT|nr:Hypothetical protein CAP_8148 [Chondromyces apiculatus DSM 436]